MSHPTPSRITAIFNHLRKQVALALPCHEELIESDEIDENPDQMLKRGWGLNITDGENTNLCISSQEYYHRRSFVLLVTREVITNESDKEGRQSKWLGLMEDLHQVMKQLAKETSIVDTTVTPPKVNSFKSAYTNDSGPRATVIRGQKYVFIELTVTIDYREPTTGGT